MCSLKISASLMWRFLKASSRASLVSSQVRWGVYRPGRMGIKSLMGLPKRHEAGDSLVSLSGVFLYWSIALWKASGSRSPFEPVLFIMSRLMVFTAISALQLLWGNATDERR